MSEPTNDANDVKPAEESAPESAPVAVARTPPAPVRIRVLPALMILALYVVATSVLLSMPQVFQNAIGAVGMPILSTLLLAIWWLAFSRAPMRDRLIGLAVFAAVTGFIVATQQRNKPLILLIALPVMNIGSVLILTATMRSAWEAQRVKVVLFLVGCAILFPNFRIREISGNFVPVVTWRWSASSEDILAKSTTAGGKADVPAKPGPNDWPGFRGSNREGVVKGVTIVTNWDEKPPKEVWRKPIGAGFSSYAVIGNYLFTQEQRKENEIVACYRADTGDEVWVNTVSVRFSEMVGDGPRATPTYEDGKLYTQGATGILQCLDASTGNTLWKADIAADTGAKVPQWGFASSPLVTDKLVVTFTGSAPDKAVIAYDKATGTKAWCGGSGKEGYSSAQLLQVHGVPQIVVTSGFGVQSFDPVSGAVLWSNEWLTKTNPRVVQPTLVDGGRAVLVGTAEGKGTRYLQIAQSDSGWTATEKWTSREFCPYFNDYVLHKGYCYGFDGNMLVCMDSATGYRRWKGPRCGGQVLLVENSDALIVLTEKGDLMLVHANPSEYKMMAKIKALTGKTWNHPVLANGKLFVRNAEEAACYDLPA